MAGRVFGGSRSSFRRGEASAPYASLFTNYGRPYGRGGSYGTGGGGRRGGGGWVGAGGDYNALRGLQAEADHKPEYQPAQEGLLTLRKSGDEAITVQLTPFQVRRIFTGQSSVSVKPYWRAIGIAHAANKCLKSYPADTVQKELEPSKTELEQSAGGQLPGVKRETLTGPCQMLEPYGIRDISFRQPNAAGEEIRYISAFYDKYNIVFVDNNGHCLYVEKEQIKDAYPVYEAQQNQDEGGSAQ